MNLVYYILLNMQELFTRKIKDSTIAYFIRLYDALESFANSLENPDDYVGFADNFVTAIVRGLVGEFVIGYYYTEDTFLDLLHIINAELVKIEQNYNNLGYSENIIFPTISNIAERVFSTYELDNGEIIFVFKRKEMIEIINKLNSNNALIGGLYEYNIDAELNSFPVNMECANRIAQVRNLLNCGFSDHKTAEESNKVIDPDCDDPEYYFA